MSASKTLAWGVGVWVTLGLVPARADSISQGQGAILFRMVWSSAGSSTSPATPTPAPQPAPTPAPPVMPIVASAPQPTVQPAPVVATPADIPPMSPVLMGAATLPTATFAAQPTASVASTAAPVDAFINMTTGPFPSAGSLGTGTPQPWYDSPAAIHAFGGVADAHQQASFVQSVLQDVQHTFQISGLNPTLTIDSTAPALHTLSVVSGLVDATNPGAIGLTNVGGNGVSFIDQFKYADNPTDLAWALAHNIAHELMHAFGVGTHPDGGNYVDAGTADWSTLTNPDAKFGPAATQLLLASQYGTLSSGDSASGIGAEVLNPQGNTVEGEEVIATPEPATMAMWAVGALGGLVVLRRRAARLAA